MSDEIEITVRPLEASDARVMLQGLQDERLYAYIDEHPPTDLDNLQARYEALCQGAPPNSAEKWLNWIIMDSDTGEPIGTLQATIDMESNRASIAYVALRGSW